MEAVKSQTNFLKLLNWRGFTIRAWRTEQGLRNTNYSEEEISTGGHVEQLDSCMFTPFLAIPLASSHEPDQIILNGSNPDARNLTYTCIRYRV